MRDGFDSIRDRVCCYAQAVAILGLAGAFQAARWVRYQASSNLERAVHHQGQRRLP